MNISGINKYMTFGLKEEWVQILADENDNFRSTSALGNRMIPSAITWFREAKLISDSTMVKPTRLLDVGKTLGFDSDLLWCLIWISLVNNSPLIKWYVCNTQVEELTSDNKALARKIEELEQNKAKHLINIEYFAKFFK